MKVLYLLSIKIMLIRSFQAEIVRKKGKNLLSDPIFNKVIIIISDLHQIKLDNHHLWRRCNSKSSLKGLGFPRTERDRLGIRGLVPPST